jgi:hypothetical protein
MTLALTTDIDVPLGSGGQPGAVCTAFLRVALVLRRTLFEGIAMASESVSEVRRKLAELEASYADQLARSDAELLGVARQVLVWWRQWWRDHGKVAALAIEPRLRSKFIVCFPMAAHAMNQIDMALNTIEEYPWVAKSSVRIAFEHALTAQWVLLTADGEERLKSAFDRSDYTRRDRFIRGVRRLGDADIEFANAAHGLGDSQLQALVGTRPEAPARPNMEEMCKRFAGGGAEDLLYDVHRDLSGAVHPSLALLCAHLRLGADGTLTGLDSRGGQAFCGSDRELAMSAAWALYTLEVCRAGQPHADEVIAVGTAIGLPIDLRASDQRPDLQPTDKSAYWFVPLDESGGGLAHE